jgi:hypothetical protein
MSSEAEEKTAHRTNDERRRRDRKIWLTGFVVSVVLHLAVFLFWPTTTLPTPQDTAAGPEMADDRAAQGGLRALALADPTVPPPIPVPDAPPPEDLEIEMDAVPEIEFEPVELPQPGTGDADDGDDTGDTGLPEATGTGAGAGGDGEEGRMIPPTVRGAIPPPSNPDLRGFETVVHVFVDEDGRVVADSTRLEPPTPDSRFNQRLLDQVADYRFQPARQGDQVRAAWAWIRLGW